MSSEVFNELLNDSDLNALNFVAGFLASFFLSVF